MSFILLGILNSQAAAGGAGAYDLLETTVLTSSASSVEFTGLGDYSDYKHLQIRLVGRSTRSGSGENLRIRFNGDTGSNYANHFLQGNGSSIFSGAETSNTGMLARNLNASSSPANAFGAFVIDILDFADTSKNTTVRTLGGSTSDNFIALSSGAYFNTNAITSIDLDPQGSHDFVTGSRFSLYGIKAA